MSYAWRFLLRSLIAGLVAPGAFAARVTLNVEAPDGEVAEIAKVAPELSQDVWTRTSGRRSSQIVRDRGRSDPGGARTAGYYGVRVESDLQRPDTDGTWKASFRVIPGNPVIVDDVRIVVPGPAGGQPEVKTALDAFLPKKGDRLDHSAYEHSKAQIDMALRTTGLSRGRSHTTPRRRDQVLNTAEIRPELGTRRASSLRRGGLLGRTVSREFPAALRAVERGRILYRRRADRVSATARRSIILERRRHAALARDQGMPCVPLDVLLIPAKRTMYSANLYVSTDSGRACGLRAQRRWLQQAGTQARRRDRILAATAGDQHELSDPGSGPKNRHFDFGAGYRDEETDTSTSRMARLAATEVRDRWKGFTRTLGLQYLNGNFEIADTQGDTEPALRGRIALRAERRIIRTSRRAAIRCCTDCVSRRKRSSPIQR